MSGIDEARKTAEKFKKESEAKKELQGKALVEVKNDLDRIRKNPDLLKMYQESADIGAENLSGSLPYLKVHIVGKSSTNELPDGNQPNDGWFFYKPTQEQFKTVECHVLTVSRGYYAEPLQKRDDGKKTFTQILAGTIIQQGRYLPFFTHFTGLKLSYLWDFGKEASRYTKLRPLAIPMFALKVKLSTERIKTNNKLNPYSWIIRFEIIKSEDGYSVIVTDSRLFQSLRLGVEKMEDKIETLIVVKAQGEEELERLQPLGENQGPSGRSEEPIVPDDIPF